MIMASTSITSVDTVIALIKFLVDYIIPIAALIVSIIAVKKSNDAKSVKIQLSEVEDRLNEYELFIKQHEYELIKNENDKPKIAKIEARVVNISKRDHRLKVWNSGNVTGYNIKVEIPQEYNIIVLGDKMPFEYLEPGNSFEEHLLFTGSSAAKFRIISKWEDENGEAYSNEQLRSL